MEAVRPPASFRFENPPHILIVEARFYSELADMQMQGVMAVLDSVNASHEVVSVPGSLEIPAAIAFAVKALDFDPLRRRPDGYVALGCILKGGTHHDQIVATESARGLQDLAIHHSLAVGNGILTCDTMQQARERADPAHLNRGGQAAEAALRMIELKQHFRLTPKRRWVAK